MNLLVVTHYYPEHGGGIERVAGELATRFEREGMRIRWLATARESGTTAPGAEPEPGWNGAERWLGVPLPLWGPASTLRIWNAVSWADAVHVHDYVYFGSLLAVAAARAQCKPLVITQHIGMIHYPQAPLRGVLSLANATLGRAALSTASHVVWVADGVARYWRERVGRVSGSVIANGVDHRRFHPVSGQERGELRRQYGLGDQPTLLFVGRFVTKKGLGILQELVRRFREVQWMFVGWGPEDPSKWQEPHVRVMHAVSHEQVVGFYRCADLLVLPSTGEGFPLVVQEAMACGTPALISTEVSEGAPSVETVCWSAPRTVEGFAAALESLLDGRGVLERQRPVVARFALESWDWDRCAADYQQLFATLTRAAPALVR